MGSGVVGANYCNGIGFVETEDTCRLRPNGSARAAMDDGMLLSLSQPTVPWMLELF
jgi:hypothetical protein